MTRSSSGAPRRPRPPEARELAWLLAGLEPELRGCDGRALIEGLATDSREAGPGQLFAALKGARADGHSFVGQALEGGARVALVERGRMDALDPKLRRLAGIDGLDMRWPDICARFFGQPGRSLTTIGVTGTNGKTTTTHLLSQIFQHAGLEHLRLGTTGNWIVDHEEPARFTTPFPAELQALLARGRDEGARAVMMEVSSHALAQARVAPLRFDAVAMTSFSQDHLDFHRSMEDYLAAKVQLAGAYADPDALAVAPVGVPAEFLKRARERGLRSYSVDPDGSARGAAVALEHQRFEKGAWRGSLRSPWGSLALELHLLGRYNVENALVAATLAMGLGLSPETVESALRQLRGPPGRLEHLELADEEVPGPRVFVDYCHTPDAVERALRTLREVTQGSLHIVLGCGGDRDREKRPLMGAAAAREADVFWASSDNPRSEDPELIIDEMVEGVAGLADAAQLRRESDRARAIAQAIAQAGVDDVVLLAGKGHERTQEIAGEKFPFDDAELGREALRARVES